MTDTQQPPLLSPAAEKRLFDLAEGRGPDDNGLGSGELMEYGFESKSRVQLTSKGAAEYWRLKQLRKPTTVLDVLPVSVMMGVMIILAGGVLLGLLLS